MTLDELYQLEKSATPGPWKDENGNVDGAISYFDKRHDRDVNIFGLDLEGYAICSNKPDSNLIAVSRNILPEVIALVRAHYNCKYFADAEDCMAEGNAWQDVSIAFQKLETKLGAQ